MAKLYTLAIGADMLIATVPDGEDIHAAVSREAADNNLGGDLAYQTIDGCTLTDEDVDAGSGVVLVWQSGNDGWICDETGKDWRFAIQA